MRNILLNVQIASLLPLRMIHPPHEWESEDSKWHSDAKFSKSEHASPPAQESSPAQRLHGNLQTWCVAAGRKNNTNERPTTQEAP